MTAYFKIYISLMITVLLLLLIPLESSAKTSTALGSRSLVTQEEIGAATSISCTITIYSSFAGYSAYNWYGASTNSTNIFRAAVGVGSLYSMSFYHGHGGWGTWWCLWPPWQPHIHTQFAIVTDAGSPWVHDNEIYWYTSCQNVKFVCLWSCSQGDEIGSMITYPCGQVNPHGMPFENTQCAGE